MTAAPAAANMWGSQSRLGRRGAVLLLLGAAWFLVGVSMLIVPDRTPDYQLLEEWLPVQVRSGLWMLSGLVAVGYAWVPPRWSDAPGFTALYVMPAVRAVSYLVAWADFAVDGEGGDRHGWLTALFYMVFVGIVGIVAGWREPVEPEPPPDPGHRG